MCETPAVIGSLLCQSKYGPSHGGTLLSWRLFYKSYFTILIFFLSNMFQMENPLIEEPTASINYQLSYS